MPPEFVDCFNQNVISGVVDSILTTVYIFCMTERNNVKTKMHIGCSKLQNGKELQKK